MLSSRGFRQAQSIGQVRALHEARSTYEHLLSEAVREACGLGVPRSVLADVLGIHRATFYRQYGAVVGGDVPRHEGRPPAAPDAGEPV